MAHSLADLKKLTLKLADERPLLKTQGIELVAWGPDAESRTVIARIADYSAERAQALQEQYGGSSWITVEPWVGPLPRRM